MGKLEALCGMAKKSETAYQAQIALQEEAWVGDAVLELFARCKVLEECGKLDLGMKTRFTQNQFLSSIGEPTRVEAEIGRVYRAEGLESAFAWIRAHLEPVFAKQEANRRKTARG